MAADISHLTSLFEHATEGIVLTGHNGNIVLLNPAAEKMFGYESGEIIGKPIEILIPDNIKPHHRQLREGFYQNPSNRVMGHGRDLNGRRKDGKNLPVEVSLSYYSKDSELFVIAFIVDITRRKAIEANMLKQQEELAKVSQEIRVLNSELEAKVEERTLILKEALQRLEQSQSELSEALDKEKQLNEIKSRFVSMASHEFRTPLSTVLSSASLLSKYNAPGDLEKRTRHIDKIKSSVKHLNDILEDFLSLGRLDEGKISAISTLFNLKEFITDVQEELTGLLKQGQSISLHYEGQPLVCTDSKLLKNIIINIITNASKFSEEGKEIMIGIKTSEEQAVIEIRDRGIGISKDDLQHIFSSFFRAANAVNIQGTGLGLHIVKRYLELLDGEISISSELGKGTYVTIFIPQHNPG